ncbi:Skp1 domain-containing protein [Bodo saltans virus]|uniref:Skp1 domain-containing protein n=1 Tax=Bodo saltans virus TaxID=2024608 RepID=A0A2H4UTP4_9VIRU|nr:Skp1 domain-containing protein [Bodo saltans virus]ATZ80258.1 Skp1 domain-containing protein [Bodo saltans virus]
MHELSVSVSVSSDTSKIDWTTQIALSSSDNIAYNNSEGENTKKYYIVPKNVAKMSKLLCEKIDNLQKDERGEFALVDIDGKTLYIILLYMHYHVNNRAEPIQKPLLEPLKNLLNEWDNAYVNKFIIPNMLYKVSFASNYMKIDDLHSLCCAIYADLMKGKSVDEIRKIFDIEDDLTMDDKKNISWTN